MTDKLRPLDLSNLLKHAFLSGLEYEAYSSKTDDELWTSYDPSECAAFDRVVKVLEKDLSNQIRDGMTTRTNIDTSHYEWVVSRDPNKQPDRSFEDYHQAAKTILHLMEKLERANGGGVEDTPTEQLYEAWVETDYSGIITLERPRTKDEIESLEIMYGSSLRYQPWEGSK